MFVRAWQICVLLCVCFVFTKSEVNAGSNTRIKVAVASNFALTAKMLASKFEQQYGHQVTLLVGSSGKHASQIEYGLAVDVYMAADTERPLLLENKGLAEENTRATYALGRLAVWSADSLLLSQDLSIDRLKHIVKQQAVVSIANPKIAPYGVAAEQAIKALLLDPKLVYGESVAQAFQFVHGGGAQLGFLALSQVKNLDGGSYYLLPESLHEPIAQQLIVIEDSPLALQWRDFVLSDSAQALIAANGYQAVVNIQKPQEKSSKTTQ